MSNITSKISSLYPVISDKTFKDFISFIIFIHFPISMLEIQIISAWDEEFWLKKEQLETALFSMSTETFLSSNILIFFLLFFQNLQFLSIISLEALLLQNFLLRSY